MPPIDPRHNRHRLPDALSRPHHNITPPPSKLPRSIPAPELVVGRLSDERATSRLRDHVPTAIDNDHDRPKRHDPVDGLGFREGCDFVVPFEKKGKALSMPLRKALTGQPRGPEMAAFMPLMQARPRL